MRAAIRRVRVVAADANRLESLAGPRHGRGGAALAAGARNLSCVGMLLPDGSESLSNPSTHAMPHRKTGPISLRTFSLGDMLRCGVEIRRAAAECESMEGAAGAVLAFLDGALRDAESGRPSCVLMRCFVTLPYGSLPAELQESARAAAQGVPPAEHTRCLVLLATRGDLPEWNDRRASRGHRAIPLASPEVVEQAPMIARMMRQMGVDLGTLLRPASPPDPDAAARTYDVFYVPEAAGSEHIPAQEEFVVRHGVRSVVGFGGVLQEEFFVVILFSREAVPEDAAGRFRNVALDARLALLRHEQTRVFEPEEPAP